MNPQFKASLAADRTLDRVNLSPHTRGAYETLVDELQETRKSYDSGTYGLYIEKIAASGEVDSSSLATGYALENFSILDRNGNDQIEKAEIEARLSALNKGKDVNKNLPEKVERKLAVNLDRNFSWMIGESQDKSFWTFGLFEVDALTRADLKRIEERSNYLKTINPIETLLPGVKSTADVKNLPESVRSLLDIRGVSVKTVPGTLRASMAEHVERYPTLAFAAGVYSAPTNEITTEAGKHKDEYQQHEIGHFVDDALADGRAYFSDSDEFVQELSKDMAKLPDGINWNNEIPGLHPYVAGALFAKSFSSSSRKELFAEIYQSKDQVVAEKLRRYFPHSSGLIEAKLKNESIDRFPSDGIPTV